MKSYKEMQREVNRRFTDRLSLFTATHIDQELVARIERDYECHCIVCEEIRADTYYGEEEYVTEAFNAVDRAL